MNPLFQQGKPLYDIIGGIVAIILFAFLGWYIYSSPAYISPIISTNPSETPSTPTLPSTPSQTPTPIPTSNTTVIWRGDGVAMADLGLIAGYKDDLNPVTPGDYHPIKYYDMGTDGSNKIILTKAPATDPSGSPIFFFEQTQAGYKFMSAMSAQYIYTPDTKQGYYFSSRVTATDTTTFYNDLIGPEKLNYQGLDLYQPYTYALPPSDLFSNYVADEQTQSSVTVSKLDTIDSGDIYIQQNIQDQQNQLAIRSYILKLKSGLYASYSLRYSFMSDDKIPHITWTGGIQNKDSYLAGGSLGHCGGLSGIQVPLQDVSGRIQQTGTTSDGQPIYEFKSQNDPMVKYFYGLVGKTYNQATGQYESVSLQEFWSHHAIILYKDGLGDYVIFTNNTYGSGVECGKPVIYLYPTKPTNVRVQVGANITASEPAYNNGWNVQAQPNGTLTTADGKTYDSLFWEGTGHGDYPAITEGTIVSKPQLADTLKSQLAQLGLTEKESADFLTFWLPKMPTMPYTRLTWFTTSQLNELAPLVVLPRPDTTIRVFLDFQGLESPVSLKAQHLTAIPRRGFTLVEWGGLLKK